MPDIKTTPPAATPSTAPAAPSSPPAASTPTTAAPAVEGGGGGDDPFAELDKSPDFAPATPKAPEAPPKPGDKPAKPESGAKPVREPKELRQRLDQVESELHSKEATMADLQKKLADAEAKSKDTTLLTKRISELQAQIDAKEGELRRAEFKASPEFQKNYDDKWKRKIAVAQGEIESLPVGEWRKDEATETMNFVPRGKADWNRDFASIYSLDRSLAKQRAKQLFGADDADLIMEHYTDLHRFQTEMNDALESERTQWQASRDKELADRKTQEEGFMGAVQTAQKDYEEKMPQWYKDDPADPKTKELLDKGWSLVRAQPKTFKEAVVLRARNQMNAAAAPMLQYKLTKVGAELAAAKETIERLKGSKPGVETKRGGTPAEPQEWDERSWAQEAKEALTK